MSVLVDSCVLLDVMTEDSIWFEWSSKALARLAEREPLIINPIIYSEVSVGFDRIEDLDAALPPDFIVRAPLPWEAGFLAGKSYLRYCRAGGVRHAPLPDFYIGAHAAVGGMGVLTRDAARFRTYFPRLRIISPN